MEEEERKELEPMPAAELKKQIETFANHAKLINVLVGMITKDWSGFQKPKSIDRAVSHLLEAQGCCCVFLETGGKE